MRVIKGKTFAEVYKKSLEGLLNNPEYESAPRGMKIKENINTTLIIENPIKCLYDNARRGSQYKYIAAELVWYFTGRNDLNFIEKYAAFWRQIANSDDTLNSAYGHLIFSSKNEHGISQWQWALNSLIKDKDSRQALMTFNRPSYAYEDNKDFICTLNGLFNIRNNKLNLTINMRSNDAILGMPTDIAFFCMLLQQAYTILKETYPELEIGTYTHIANSLHIYERHFKLVEEMLEEDFIPRSYINSPIEFVDKNGHASKDLIDLTSSIEEGSNFTSDNPMLNWIKSQLSE